MATVEDFLIDFNKEEDSGGGGNIRVPDDTHRVKVLAAKPTVSAQKGSKGLEVTFVFLDGKLRKKKIKDTLWFSPKAYSRFRLLLEACGKPVPKKVKASSVAAAIKGEELYIETETEEREGYDPRSRVAFRGFINPDDYDPDDEGDEEEDEEEEEELEDEEDEEEEEDEDEEEDEEEEEEEEEEEPEPPKRRRAARPSKKAKAKPAAKKTTARKRKAKPKDEDEDLDDLDLDDY